jgi:5,10-methylenetetrahydrofolate reductase
VLARLELELLEILAKYREAGINSILALRGDPVGGPRAPWTKTDGGLRSCRRISYVGS